MKLFPQLNDGSLAHWLVVDPIRVPDIAQLAYRYEKNPELKHLFAGTPFDHLMAQSPVAFRYTGHPEMEAQLRDDFALRSSSVLFSGDATLPTESVIQHLQALLYVLVEESPVLFRYYASPMWESVAAELSEADICTLLGPCQAMSWIDTAHHPRSLWAPQPTPQTAVRLPYHLKSPVLKALVEQRYG